MSYRTLLLPVFGLVVPAAMPAAYGIPSTAAPRPWRVLGEGPQLANLKPMQGPGFNAGEGSPFTAEDIRFTTKGDTLYAHVLGTPKATVTIKSLGTAAGLSTHGSRRSGSSEAKKNSHGRKPPTRS